MLKPYEKKKIDRKIILPDGTILNGERFKKLGIRKVLELLNHFSELERTLFFEGIEYDWDFWARDAQRVPDGDWMYWLLNAGRAFGKTYTGAQTIRKWAETGEFPYCNLIGRTMDDVEKTMVSGPSGILSVCDPDFMPIWKKKDRMLEWPNGVVSLFFSAEEPESLRGPNHSKVWADEICAWKYAKETWDQMKFGLRNGPKPQCVISTTPKKNHKVLKEIWFDKRTVKTTGSTDENTMISDQYREMIIDDYAGTSFGNQEINGEFVMTDDESAIFNIDIINKNRIEKIPEDVKIDKIIVALDPSVSANENSDEAGIVVVARSEDKKAYLLEDLSGKMTAKKWAEIAVNAYYRHGADKIIAETNQGGDLVEMQIKGVDDTVVYESIKADVNKKMRATPVGTMYERGKVIHVGSDKKFELLENQMIDFDPNSTKDSPDRMDALVWAVHDLLLKDENGNAKEWIKQQQNSLKNSLNYDNIIHNNKNTKNNDFNQDFDEFMGLNREELNISKLDKIFGR